MGLCTMKEAMEPTDEKKLKFVSVVVITTMLKERNKGHASHWEQPSYIIESDHRTLFCLNKDSTGFIFYTFLILRKELKNLFQEF